ncbi:MAG: hypothetical protein H3C30_06400 [Candidatus Hydrogenedentes bacterium]|nr:hypothetical protein [Candidatus Hydrogenedentota bacterium]
MNKRTVILLVVLAVVAALAGAFYLFTLNEQRQTEEIAASLRPVPVKPEEETPKAPKERAPIASTTNDGPGVVPVTVESLKLMPEGTQVALGIPPVAVLVEKLVPVAQLVYKNDLDIQKELDDRVTDLAAMAGLPAADTAVETLAAMGLDPQRAAAVFLNAAEIAQAAVGALAEAEKAAAAGERARPPRINPEDLKFAAVLPVADAAKVEELLLDFIGGPNPEEEKVGDVTVKVYDGLGAYFLTDKALVLGNSPEMVKSSAGRVAAPAEFRYGTDACPVQNPNEMVLMAYARDFLPILGSLAENSELMKNPVYGPLVKGQVEQLGRVFGAEGAEDPILITVGMTDTGVVFKSKIDTATHPGVMDLTGTAQPLRLAPLLPDDTHGFLSIRINDELKAQLMDMYQSAAKEGDPRMAQAKTYVTQVMNMLGDEITLGITGLGQLDFPGIYLGVVVAQPPTAQILLSLAGLQPVEEHNGCQISSITLPFPIPVYQVLADNVILLSNSLDGMKGLIDRIISKEATGFFAAQTPPINAETPRYHALFLNTGLYTDVVRQITLTLAPTMVPKDVDGILVEVGNIVRDIRVFNEMNGSWQEGSIALSLRAPVAAPAN